MSLGHASCLECGAPLRGNPALCSVAPYHVQWDWRAHYQMDDYELFYGDLKKQLYDDILDAVTPQCTSNDPSNHQGNTCPVHES